jgi:hypothetical protein
MYYCENYANALRKRGELSLYADLNHMDHCSCHLMHLYTYKMVDQSDHIRTYWENSGFLKVHWNINYGMLLEYPKGIRVFFDIHYPYDNDIYIEIRNENNRRRHKQDSARRRKHKLLIWKKK